VADQKWVFKRTKSFIKAFNALTPGQQTKARAAFNRFKKNPPLAQCPKKNRLSALARRTIRGFHIEKNLIVTFTIQGNEIISLDIGTHDVYK